MTKKWILITVAVVTVLVMVVIIFGVVGTFVAVNGTQVSLPTGSPTAISAPSVAAVSPTVTATPSPTASTPTVTAAPSTSSAALVALNTVKVEAADGSTYNRVKDFGTAWKDMDNNGCDTRDDILKRDLTNVVYRAGSACIIQTGNWYDPYTNTSGSFVRGVGTSTVLNIDHIYPLGLAAEHGAEKWTFEQREQFANDPSELLTVTSRPNEQKSDSGPSSWLPPNAAYQCEYVTKFVMVSVKWNLSMDTDDWNASKSVLSNC